MNINEIIDFYKDSKEEKENKTKEYLKKILDKDFEVLLRIIDPRVNNLACYGKINNDDYNKILKIYPTAKIEYESEGTIKFISTIGGPVKFTIYNVNNENKDKLIAKHDKEYEEQKEKLIGKVMF